MIIFYQEDSNILLHILFGKNLNIFSLIKLINNYYTENKNISYDTCKILVLMKKLELSVYALIDEPDHVIFHYVINPPEKYPIVDTKSINIIDMDEIIIKSGSVNDSAEMIQKYKKWNGKKFNKLAKSDIVLLAADVDKYFDFNRDSYPLKYFYRNPIFFDEFLSNKLGIFNNLGSICVSLN